MPAGSDTLGVISALALKSKNQQMATVSWQKKQSLPLLHRALENISAQNSENQTHAPVQRLLKYGRRTDVLVDKVQLRKGKG